MATAAFSIIYAGFHVTGRIQRQTPLRDRRARGVAVLSCCRRVGWRDRPAPLDLPQDPSVGRTTVANREQRGNKEKKKPKQDKNKGEKTAPPPFVQPEIVRKPHKGKQQG
jgi:hypothetical protein